MMRPFTANANTFVTNKSFLITNPNDYTKFTPNLMGPKIGL